MAILVHIVRIVVTLALRDISFEPSRNGRYLAKNRLRISRSSNAGKLFVKNNDANKSGPTVGIPGKMAPNQATTTQMTPSAAKQARFIGLRFVLVDSVNGTIF